MPAFDMKFLNAELNWAGQVLIANERALDTVAIARRKFPGAPASLDALCRRFGIDNSAREKHGALLDSELLAEVYLELIGGRQPDFGLAEAAAPQSSREGRGEESQVWTAPAAPGAACAASFDGRGCGPCCLCRKHGRQGDLEEIRLKPVRGRSPPEPRRTCARECARRTES
jgi:hypothetical protein